jgi:hypothetical protein
VVNIRCLFAADLAFEALDRAYDARSSSALGDVRNDPVETLFTIAWNTQLPV